MQRHRRIRVGVGRPEAERKIVPCLFRGGRWSVRGWFEGGLLKGFHVLGFSKEAQGRFKESTMIDVLLYCDLTSSLLFAAAYDEDIVERAVWNET